MAVALFGAVTGCLDRQLSLTSAPGEPGAGPSGAWPNQPAGFRAFAENDFARPMIATPSATGLLGQWSAAITDEDNGYINDPTSPKSPPGVFQGRFPAGMTPGFASIKWQGWDAASNADNYGTEMSQIYLSLWLRLPGADFENQTTAGTKLKRNPQTNC